MLELLTIRIFCMFKSIKTDNNNNINHAWLTQLKNFWGIFCLFYHLYLFWSSSLFFIIFIIIKTKQEKNWEKYDKLA